MSEDNNEIIYTHAAYDDAFRTLEEECDDTLLRVQKRLIFVEYRCIIIVAVEVCDVSDSCTEVLM